MFRCESTAAGDGSCVKTGGVSTGVVNTGTGTGAVALTAVWGSGTANGVDAGAVALTAVSVITVVICVFMVAPQRGQRMSAGNGCGICIGF
jgi:hypothetical protein